MPRSTPCKSTSLCIPLYAPTFLDSAVSPRDGGWLIPQTSALVSPSQLKELLPGDGVGMFSPLWRPPDVAAYHQVFCSFQELFAAAVIEKAVPVVFSRASVPDFSDWFPALLHRVIGVPDQLFPYALHYGGQFMLGASPEVLFRISQDGMVTSEALAGSARIDDGANLVHDPKNVREHNLVVEDVCAQLSSLGPLQRESRSVSPLSGVAHLRTVVRCYPPAPPSFSDLVSLLHPTPALGIAPRAAQTLELLQRLDPLAERGRFGAPFGAILPDGEALCIVAIRNVQWQDGILRLGAGAGILKESSFEAEFEELSLKQRVVAELLFPHTGSAHLSKHSGRQHSSS